MRAKNVLLFAVLLVLSSKVFATDQWRVFGPGYVEKSQYSSPPFCKWHKTNIDYNIISAPSGLGYLIDDSFDTWETCGYLSFSSGNDITIETLSGSHAWFGYGPFTHDSKGEITSAMIQLNGGTYPYGGDNKVMVWTDGNENVNVQADTFFCDVQNCVTHELGHNLGIAHHNTGNGEPTMATRAQVPSFNTTLKRRTLETDDWLALDFLYKKSFVPSEYATIASALAAAIYGQTVLVLSGTNYISGTVTVPYAVTLNIKGGTVKGSGGTNPKIDGNVHFNSSSNAKLQDLTVTETIFVNNSSGVDIDRVDRIYSYGGGIDLYNSSADIWQFDISNNYQGIYSHGSSVADISYCDITNSSYGLKLYGSTSTDVWGMGFCENNYDIWLEAGGDIWIEEDNMMFSDYPEDCTYGVEELPEEYDICGLRKRITDSAPAGNSGQDSKPVISLQNNDGADEYGAGASIIREIKAEIREKKESGIETNRQDYASDYGWAIDLFKQVIDRYPDSPWTINALSRLQASYRELGEFEQLSEYAYTLLDDPKYQALRPYVLNSLIPYHLYNDDYEQALQLSEDILAYPPNDELACEVLYGKGIIYRYYVNDSDKASAVFKEVLAAYPDNPTALSAQAELENMGEEYVPGDSTSTQLASGEPVIVSYPNPFNPVNTIRFALPEEGQVILKVYNVLGREVATLLNEVRPAGSHVVTFDGSRLVSGVYIYRLEAGGEVLSGKMILLK